MEENQNIEWIETSNSKYSKNFNVSERTALRDLKELVEKNLLIKAGEKNP